MYSQNGQGASFKIWSCLLFNKENCSRVRPVSFLERLSILLPNTQTTCQGKIVDPTNGHACLPVRGLTWACSIQNIKNLARLKLRTRDVTLSTIESRVLLTFVSKSLEVRDEMNPSASTFTIVLILSFFIKFKFFWNLNGFWPGQDQGLRSLCFHNSLIEIVTFNSYSISWRIKFARNFLKFLFHFWIEWLLLTPETISYKIW